MAETDATPPGHDRRTDLCYTMAVGVVGDVPGTARDDGPGACPTGAPAVWWTRTSPVEETWLTPKRSFPAGLPW
ncbi:MAG: hypothetical protein P8124_00935 [Gammaproteobacteria bacterium]